MSHAAYRTRRDTIARPPKWLQEMAATNPMVLYSESRWQRDVMDALRDFGWRAYHTHRSEHSAAGFPDIVAVRIRRERVRLLFAELKREDGKTTRAQDEWLTDLGVVAETMREMARDWGCFTLTDAPLSVECYTWRPSQWDDVLAVLQ